MLTTTNSPPRDLGTWKKRPPNELCTPIPTAKYTKSLLHYRSRNQFPPLHLIDQPPDICFPIFFRAGDVEEAILRTYKTMTQQANSLAAVSFFKDKYCLIYMHYRVSTDEMNSSYSSFCLAPNHCSEQQLQAADIKETTEQPQHELQQQALNYTHSDLPPHLQLHRRSPEVASQVIPYMGDGISVYILKYAVCALVISYFLFCLEMTKYSRERVVNKLKEAISRPMTTTMPVSNTRPSNAGVYYCFVLLLVIYHARMR